MLFGGPGRKGGPGQNDVTTTVLFLFEKHLAGLFNSLELVSLFTLLRRLFSNIVGGCGRRTRGLVWWILDKESARQQNTGVVSSLGSTLVLQARLRGTCPRATCNTLTWTTFSRPTRIAIISLRRHETAGGTAFQDAALVACKECSFGRRSKSDTPFPRSSR